MVYIIVAGKSGRATFCYSVITKTSWLAASSAWLKSIVNRLMVTPEIG